MPDVPYLAMRPKTVFSTIVFGALAPRVQAHPAGQAPDDTVETQVGEGPPIASSPTLPTISPLGEDTAAPSAPSVGIPPAGADSPVPSSSPVFPPPETDPTVPTSLPAVQQPVGESILSSGFLSTVSSSVGNPAEFSPGPSSAPLPGPSATQDSGIQSSSLYLPSTPDGTGDSTALSEDSETAVTLAEQPDVSLTGQIAETTLTDQTPRNSAETTAPSQPASEDLVDPTAPSQDPPAQSEVASSEQPQQPEQSEVASSGQPQQSQQSPVQNTTPAASETTSAESPSNFPSQLPGGDEESNDDDDDDDDDDGIPPVIVGGGKGSPPKTDPPAVKPPTVKPPAINPPSINPPSINPPAINPPAVNPPAVNPPSGNPPEENPPEIDPPEGDRPSDPESSPPTSPSPSPTRTDDEPSTSASSATSSDPCASTEIPGGLFQRQSPDEPGACELSEEYTVIPEDGTDKTITAAALARISAIVPPADIVYTSEVDSYGVLYWSVRLTLDQANDLLQDPNIGAVTPPCHDDCYDPTTELVMQANAPDDLVTLGQFPGKDFDWYNHNYVYDERGGKDVEVYILDGGADLTHRVRYIVMIVAHKQS